MGKFARHGATMEFVNRLLGQILTPGYVDGGKPAFFAPAPDGAGRNADLLGPFLEADYRRQRN